MENKQVLKGLATVSFYATDHEGGKNGIVNF